MRCTWLGWAGLEIEVDGHTLVIDPLQDSAALYAAVGDAARDVVLPDIVAPRPGTALAGLLTHLHRDHADADALVGALAPGAPVLFPAGQPLDGAADAGLRVAWRELGATGATLRPVTPWESMTVGPFTVIALPAVDGIGDPQVSWAVTAAGRRVLHCGDTMFHGWWWRFAEAAGPFDAAFLPVNGAVLDLPWRRPSSPLPADLTPEQAVTAAQAARVGTVVAIHYGAYDLDPFYRSIPDARDRFLAAAQAAALTARAPEAGEVIEL
jgi:L-ascorbate metabolism protein UlaG (beta-lactamase superfamily)